MVKNCESMFINGFQYYVRLIHSILGNCRIVTNYWTVAPFILCKNSSNNTGSIQTHFYKKHVCQSGNLESWKCWNCVSPCFDRLEFEILKCCNVQFWQSVFETWKRWGPKTYEYPPNFVLEGNLEDGSNIYQKHEMEIWQ